MPESKIRDYVYSVIIPVYQSEKIIEETIDRTLRFFEKNNLGLQLILVNDGSTDGSWEVLGRRARADKRIVAIDLRANYGQHTALFCGLRHCSGDYAITLDDDLQNPPEEIMPMILKALAGHDVVFGRFRHKHHAGPRNLGSRFIHYLDRKAYRCPEDLVLSNYRIIRRDLIDRIVLSGARRPYITGLCLLGAASPANATVEHSPRLTGQSNYTPLKILRLVRRVMTCHWRYTLLVCAALGLSAVLAALFLALIAVATAGIERRALEVAVGVLIGVLVLLGLIVIGQFVSGELSRKAGRLPYEIRAGINLAPAQIETFDVVAS